MVKDTELFEGGDNNTPVLLPMIANDQELGLKILLENDVGNLASEERLLEIADPYNKI